MVKCCECGFLSVRRKGDNVLCEAHDYWRESGQVSPKHMYEIAPVCFVMALPIAHEMAGVGKDEERPKRFVEIINKERDCAKFFPWVQGYSPKEHRDMLHEKMMIELQQAQRERERAWQDEQKAKDREWQAKQKIRDRFWSVLILILGAAIGWAFNKYLGK